MTDETDIERQLQTVLEWCEVEHGRALEHKQREKALSLYHIVELLEDAQQLKLKNPRELRQDRWRADQVKRSRKAREAGYREATLLDELGQSDDEPATLRELIRGIFS